MPNVILTPKVILNLALMNLGGKLSVARNMSRALTKEFAKKSYKVGDTVQYWKPYRFVGGNGLDYDPEAITDQVGSVTVNQMPHVHFEWNLVERTLDLREANELYGVPVAMALAAKINSMAATYAANNALNSVGTPGTAPTTPLTYLTAGDVLCELGLPEGEELNLIINRRMSSAYVNGTTNLFNPTGMLSKQYSKGEMVDSLGYNVIRDQTINVRTNGTFGGSPVVNGGGQSGNDGNNGTMTLNTNGWSSGATSLKLGDKFTIANVNSVHPQTRVSTGRLQIFTVQADISDTTGAINMVVAPAITATGPYQNVDSTPAASAVITVIGTTALANIQQGLLMHKNAFAFVSVPLNEPASGSGGKMTQSTDPDTGLTMCHTVFFDGNKLVEKHRFDTLIGFGPLYKEMACVVQA